jgi:hypothetical protein
MRTYKYSQGQSRCSEQMMFVGIQPNEGHAIDDEIIVFISKGENRFSYFNVEEANYTIFREVNDIELFTTSVIDFLTEFPNGKVSIREDDDDEEFLFMGSIKQFLKVWTNDLDD